MLSDGEFIIGLTLVAGAGTELIKLLCSWKVVLHGSYRALGIGVLYSFIHIFFIFLSPVHSRMLPSIHLFILPFIYPCIYSLIQPSFHVSIQSCIHPILPCIIYVFIHPSIHPSFLPLSILPFSFLFMFQSLHPPSIPLKKNPDSFAGDSHLCPFHVHL